MIPWLNINHNFPPVEQALKDPNGLLCAGGELSSTRLLSAYKQGIFPWYSQEEPILWWSPDPRMVLFPSEFKLHRSLYQRLKRQDYELKLDTHFSHVIQACGNTPRKGQNGTWITPEIYRAYTDLHTRGYAHSIETWEAGKLTGGLYGVAIGKVFYGESMFSVKTDASKIAFAHLIRFLQSTGFELIDCQMATPHLASLGGREIPRSDFLKRLETLTTEDAPPKHWPSDGAQYHWATSYAR